MGKAANGNKIIPYDKTDRDSILQYAAKLTGHSLSEFADILDEDDPIHAKGYFGQALETGYFFLDNNSSPLPDFPEAGLELKSTPMKEVKRGLVSKERLILGIINYMEVNEEGCWKKVFGKKSEDLLIVFYRHVPGVPYYEYRIIKVTEWTFPEEDLRIMKEDWNVIERYILEGKAEQLSEGLTNYLAACTKGVGHGKDLRQQPFSDVKAKQRALSLKSSYVNRIFKGSTDLSEVVFKERVVSKSKKTKKQDDTQNLFEEVWDESTTFEESVIQKMSRYVGMKCGEIEKSVGTLNPESKSYYAYLSRYMLGVKTRDIREFCNADIALKTIRLNTKNKSKESMSFPFFDFKEVAEQDWDDSDFQEQLDKKFFFAVFRMTDAGNKDKRNAEFLGAFFWTIPYADMLEAEKVWTRTKNLIIQGDYDNFPRKSQSRVAHVRPHAKDKTDTIEGPDGKQHLKKCFWLNWDYITQVALDGLKRR